MTISDNIIDPYEKFLLGISNKSNSALSIAQNDFAKPRSSYCISSTYKSAKNGYNTVKNVLGKISSLSFGAFFAGGIISGTLGFWSYPAFSFCLANAGISSIPAIASSAAATTLAPIAATASTAGYISSVGGSVLSVTAKLFALMSFPSVIKNTPKIISYLVNTEGEYYNKARIISSTISALTLGPSYITDMTNIKNYIPAATFALETIKKLGSYSSNISFTLSLYELAYNALEISSKTIDSIWPD